MAKISPTGQKTLGNGEIVRFSFSHSVFKGLVLQTRNFKQGLVLERVKRAFSLVFIVNLKDKLHLLG